MVASWKAKYDAPRLAWSPDGKLLARTDNSTTVRVYEAATGRQVMAVGGKLRAAGVSPRSRPTGSLWRRPRARGQYGCGTWSDGGAAHGEFVGPTYQPSEVAFVPGEPPRLAAVDHQAAYLWRPDPPDPLVLPLLQRAYRVPVLTVSPDGRWLVAGPDDRLRGWDVSAGPPGPPLDLACRGQIAARFARRSDRLTVIVKAARGRTVQLRARQVRLARAGPSAPVWLSTFDVPAGLPDGSRMTALWTTAARLAQHDGAQAVHVWNVGAGDAPGPYRSAGSRTPSRSPRTGLGSPSKRARPCMSTTRTRWSCGRSGR